MVKLKDAPKSAKTYEEKLKWVVNKAKKDYKKDLKKKQQNRRKNRKKYK